MIHLLTVLSFKLVSNNMFDNLPSLAAPVDYMTSDDELTRYLAEETQPSVMDPLKWWTKKSHIYPCLSQMARNYLSIPGMPFTSLPML